MTIYIPMSVYVLHYIPLMFELPHIGSMIDYLALMLPMLLASIFLADIMQPLVTERESSMLVWVFTSVLFLFVSGTYLAALRNERLMAHDKQPRAVVMGSTGIPLPSM